MHCSDWPHGLGLIDVGLGLARFFWPRPYTFWPRPWPHDTLASLTSLRLSITAEITFSWRCDERPQLSIMQSDFISWLCVLAYCTMVRSSHSRSMRRHSYKHTGNDVTLSTKWPPKTCQKLRLRNAAGRSTFCKMLQKNNCHLTS